MDGVRFTCQPGCTACCDQKGWVYLTEADVVRAAGFTGLPQQEFEARYIYRTRHQIRLRKPPGKQCHFLNGSGCSIHPAKPTQCRTFPFWPELVESRAAWSDIARYCPGIGKGPLIQIGAAVEMAAEMRHAYPGMYQK
jgi:Fe-S-cluster containining protein